MDEMLQQITGYFNTIAEIIPNLPLPGLIAIGIILATALFFIRRPLFMLHSMVIVAVLIAAIWGIFAAILGGISAYVSIYGVNNYYERYFDPSGVFYAAVSGAFVGIIAMIVAILGTILLALLMAGIVSMLTGSSVDVPITDSSGSLWGTLHIWTPGDTSNMQIGSLGCGVSMLPGLLVAPIIGAIASVNLFNGKPLNISDVPYQVASYCMMLVAVIGLLSGAKTGFNIGKGKWGGFITGSFYGFWVARSISGDWFIYTMSILGLGTLLYYLASEGKD